MMVTLHRKPKKEIEQRIQGGDKSLNRKLPSLKLFFSFKKPRLAAEDNSTLRVCSFFIMDFYNKVYNKHKKWQVLLLKVEPLL